MPTSVIVGGQYGSEGKGKIAAHLARRVHCSVRTGGPNAGHTVVEGDKSLVLRHLPCAVVNPQVALFLGAGAIIDVDVLLEEMRESNVGPDRLHIDPCCVIINERGRNAEQSLVRRIGSTGKGVGSAVAEKVLRSDNIQLARDIMPLKPFLRSVADHLHEALARGERILLEGTQGTGLSLHHGHFPYVTSRDVTAGSLCGEAGVGPTSVDEVVLVVRTYPIRVAGPSGPLHGETTWEAVTKASGYTSPLLERTTVTKNVRRVGSFEMKAVVRAARLNGATTIALTFADYIDSGVRETGTLSRPVLEFIDRLEQAVGIPVSMVGTGPDTEDVVVR